MLKQISLMDVPIAAVTMREALAFIDGFIREQHSHLIVTANAEMVMQAQRDEELKYILQQADLVVADGAGVVWAANYNGSPVPERVAGADLATQLLILAAQRNYRVFFFGAAPGIAAKAADRVQDAHPGINICGVLDGYFSPEDEDGIIAGIKRAGPDILLVGLGVPRQEKWLWRHRETLNIPVCIGVGGVFDVLAGAVQRAPLWMRKAGLEWAYRLAKQPWRIWRMMALPRFIVRVWLKRGKK